MKGKTKKVDKLVARLTADRVLNGKGSKNQFLHLRSVMQDVEFESDEQAQKKDDNEIKETE